MTIWTDVFSQIVNSSVHHSNAFKATKVSSFSLEKQISLMTKVLYNKQRNEYGQLHLDPDEFQKMLEESDIRLQGLLQRMEKAIIPPERSAYNKKKAESKLWCFVIQWLA